MGWLIWLHYDMSFKAALNRIFQMCKPPFLNIFNETCSGHVSVTKARLVTRMTMMDWRWFFSSYDPRWWIGHSCKEVWELPWCLRALSRPDSHLLFSFSPTHGSKRELFWDFWEFPSQVVILRGGGPRIPTFSCFFKIGSLTKWRF